MVIPVDRATILSAYTPQKLNLVPFSALAILESKHFATWCFAMIQPVNDGTHKAHPSLTRRTELAWQDNDDEYGQHQEVDIAQCVILMQKIYERLSITPQQLMEFCQKWQIAELAVFGSILRDDFRQDGNNPSDIDLLFRYRLNANMSLLRRARMKIELEALCHRPVDFILITEVLASHNPSRKKRILESALWINIQG